MAFSTNMNFPPVRSYQDQVAGMETEHGLVKITFHKVELPGEGMDRWETHLDGDAARVLGEQLLAASRGQDTWSKPGIRIDIDQRWAEGLIKQHLLEQLKVKTS